MRTVIKIAAIAAIPATAITLALGGCGSKTVIIHEPAYTVTHTASAQVVVPRIVVSQPMQPTAPAVPVAGSYAQDITSAGIVAPVPWINSTGQELCQDWASGMTWTQTDNSVLTSGGIYPQHLALYDEITAQDLCPAYGGGNTP